MPPKLTNPLRPVARYRKGQAPAGAAAAAAAVDSDSDSDAERQDDEAQQAKVESEDDGSEQAALAGRLRAATKAGGRMDVKLKQVQVDKMGSVKIGGGKVESGKTGSSSEYETDSEDEKPAVKPVFKPKMPAAESEGSSEYETDSEEEEAPKPIYKPVFVSKRNRDTIAERDAELDPEVIEQRRQEEAEARKKQSHDLVAESVLREIADKDVQDTFPDVDDTDGLDAEAEFEAWKLRELMRIKRDKEALYAREKEREEVEARRALPEAIRFKEDMERADKSRKDKPKGQQVFLQKYHHKGAFYTDNEILKKHDYTAPTVSTVLDKSSLPAAMQKRDFGKRSQTKYTHLAKEDTTKQDAGWAKKSLLSGGGAGGSAGGGGGAGGCFSCGGPHLKRDCPQMAQAGPSGANGPGDAGWGSRPPPHAAARLDRERDRASEQDRDGSRDRDRALRYEREDERQRERYARDDDGGDRFARRAPPPLTRDGPPGRDRRGVGFDRDGGGDRRRSGRSRSRSRSPARRTGGEDERDRNRDRDRDREKRRRIE